MPCALWRCQLLAGRTRPTPGKVDFGRPRAQRSGSLGYSGNVSERARGHVLCQAQQSDVQSKGWATARQLFENGEIYEGFVTGVNKGGVVVDCWGVVGFIPNSMVSPSGRPEEGQRVRALFMEVDELQNRMVLSQRQLLQAELLRSIKPDSFVEGKVTWLEAYGAFVDIALADGRTVSGLIHKSELSWRVVVVPETIVSVGEWVKCKVLDVDAKRGRVSLSLRQTKPDPLKQNLDSLKDGEVEWKESDTPLPGLDDVVADIRKCDGIENVILGKQATVPGHVVQELELWLAKDHEGDRYNAVARAGSMVQEVVIEASMSKDELKAAIDKVVQP